MGTYSKMAQLTRGWKGAIQAHHIVEVRHLKALGLSTFEAPSIILSRLEHANITRTLKELMPYGRTYTTEQILNSYRQAYRAFPEWIKSAEKYLK